MGVQAVGCGICGDLHRCHPNVKVRDGQVANRAFRAAIGVDLDGNRDVLGIWGSPASEGARYWLSVLTDLKNRGVGDVFVPLCDGLKGLPDAVGTVWPLSIVQTCVIHLMRNTFRYASRKDWEALRRDVKPIYTAGTPAAGEHARDEMLEHWAGKYPAVKGLWLNAWERFIPFLDHDVEIRRVICSTNAIEGLNARFRRSIRARGHFLGRAGRIEMPPPDRAFARPHRQGPGTMGDTMEARVERVRHHLRRPLAGRQGTATKTASHTLNEIDPRFADADRRLTDIGRRFVNASRRLTTQSRRLADASQRFA